MTGVICSTVEVVLWIVATIGPLAAAVFWWNISIESGHRWLHLLLAPLLLVAEFAVVCLYFWASGDAENSGGVADFSMLPASAIFVGVVIVYYTAVCVQLIRQFATKIRRD